MTVFCHSGEKGNTSDGAGNRTVAVITPTVTWLGGRTWSRVEFWARNTLEFCKEIVGPLCWELGRPGTEGNAES